MVDVMFSAAPLLAFTALMAWPLKVGVLSTMEKALLPPRSKIPFEMVSVALLMLFEVDLIGPVNVRRPLVLILTVCAVEPPSLLKVTPARELVALAARVKDAAMLLVEAPCRVTTF